MRLLLLGVDKLSLLLKLVPDVFLSALINLLICESIFEGRQEDVFCSNDRIFVILLKLLILGLLDEPGTILTDVVIDRVMDVLESVLLVPSSLIVLVDAGFNSTQSLILPLLDFSRKFASTILRLLGGSCRSVHVLFGKYCLSESTVPQLRMELDHVEIG